jgi:hypothetical protein
MGMSSSMIGESKAILIEFSYRANPARNLPEELEQD